MARLSPPALFFASLLGMQCLHVVFPGPRLLPLPWTLGGIPLILAGAWLHHSSYRLFRRYGTTVATLGAPALLVREGPYRFSRNPMYLSGVVILLGFAALLGTTTTLAGPLLFPILARRWYIGAEESLLEATLGSEYRAYRERVRRWI